MFRCVLALSKPMQKPVIPLVLSVVCEGTEAARRFFFALGPRARRAAQWRDLLFHRVLATYYSTYRNLSSRPEHSARLLRGIRSGGIVARSPPTQITVTTAQFQATTPPSHQKLFVRARLFTLSFEGQPCRKKQQPTGFSP